MQKTKQTESGKPKISEVDKTLKFLIIGVVAIALIFSFVFIYGLKEKSSLYGAAVNTVASSEDSSIQTEAEASIGADYKEFCSATVIHKDGGQSVFLYNCRKE